MKISFWSVGKNNEIYVKEGVEDFTRRISRYFKAEWNIIPMPKNSGILPEMELKKKEGEAIMQLLTKDDYLVALEERGKQLSSEGLAEFIQARANESTKKIIFLIGGAYGIDEQEFIATCFSSSVSSFNTFRTGLQGLYYSEKRKISSQIICIT